jgi:hypothetical protein
LVTWGDAKYGGGVDADHAISGLLPGCGADVAYAQELSREGFENVNKTE